MIVAYDYDGVIVDSLDANIAMMNSILEEMGKEASIDRAMFQRLQVISFEAIADILSLSEDEITQFMRIIGEQNDDIHTETALFPGIAEHLKRVARVAKIYIVSNNESSLVHTLLEKEGLSSLVTGVWGPENGASKADRLRQLQSMDPAVLFVGDGVSDITEGNKAGVMTIAVSWGFQSLEVLKPHSPKFCTETLEDLEHLIIG